MIRLKPTFVYDYDNLDLNGLLNFELTVAKINIFSIWVGPFRTTGFMIMGVGLEWRW